MLYFMYEAENYEYKKQKKNGGSFPPFFVNSLH